MNKEIIIWVGISILVIVLIWKNKNKKIDSLHELVKRGDINRVKVRINSLNINKVDEDGYTVFHIAVYYRQFECMKFLLKHGAFINMANKEGDTPIHSAEDDFEIIRFLLKNGANINQKNNYGSTVLMGAVSTPNNLKVVKLLLDYNADINTKNKYGNTLLHEAALNLGTIEIIKLLLNKGIEINILNNDMETPLDIAYKYENLEVVSYLLSQGAKNNIFIT